MKVMTSYSGLYAILGITSYVLTACSISYQSISLHGNSNLGFEEDKNNPHPTKSNFVVKMSNMPWNAHENDKEPTK